MKWKQPANRRVVQAVIAIFRDPVESCRKQLAPLKLSEWAQTYYWLDASGMALYFLKQVELMQLEDALPAETLQRLRRNYIDNEERSNTMFGEFKTINQAFNAIGIRHCNLKGFTLSPHACPDPAARRQSDFDFLVDSRHLEACAETLATTGYIRTGVTKSVWEFKANNFKLPEMRHFYEATPQRSVELHFDSPKHNTPLSNDLLDRAVWQTLHGTTFRALPDSDQLIGQAIHVMSHLRSANTRPSWILEYERHISFHYDDATFWDEVRVRSQTYHEAFTAIGLVNLLSHNILGSKTPKDLNIWTVDCLAPTVKLWAETYGERAVLADFPGTKLYLLLEQQLQTNERLWQETKHRHLLPALTVPSIAQQSPAGSRGASFYRILIQLQFISFRLRFHIIEGFLYFAELANWQSSLAQLQTQNKLCPRSNSDVVPVTENATS
ncbi:nucleotidyltransferase family protein [Granulicella arctica]|uniref:nucleotidyltransferase family protein n=1 Tax=Granulicella arctica TaxID=940613 RepID=UPI0021E04312|nr:nucleotidyltransferase family protein [Granulicella arctica]